MIRIIFKTDSFGNKFRLMQIHLSHAYDDLNDSLKASAHWHL